MLFPSDMVAFYQQLKREGRKVCLENGRLPPPTPEEIAAVRRRNHQTAEQLAADLAANLQYPNNQQLQTLMRQAFLDVVLEEDKAVGGNLNRLLNKAVYLVAWMKRYQKDLFQNWQAPRSASSSSLALAPGTTRRSSCACWRSCRWMYWFCCRISTPPAC